jgi:hypothetical protein
MAWRYQMWITTLLLSLFMGIHIYRRSKNATAGVLASWVLLSGANVIFNPKIVITLLELRLKLVSGRAFIIASMLMLFVSEISTKCLWIVIRLIEVVTIVNCGLMLHQGYGIFNANSMDATFLAMIYPVMIFTNKSCAPWRWIVTVVPIVTLFTTPFPGSTSFFVLFASSMTYLIATHRWRWLLAILPVIVGIAWYKNTTVLFDDAGRSGPWSLFMNWWWENANVVTGTGSGTFTWLGPEIQGKSENLFTWMHSEPLQILFEQGIVGLTLSCCLLVICLYRAWNRPWLLSAIVGTCTASLTQFPLRFALSALFILILIRLSLVEESP